MNGAIIGAKEVAPLILWVMGLINMIMSIKNSTMLKITGMVVRMGSLLITVINIVFFKGSPRKARSSLVSGSMESSLDKRPKVVPGQKERRSLKSPRKNI